MSRTAKFRITLLLIGGGLFWFWIDSAQMPEVETATKPADSEAVIAQIMAERVDPAELGATGLRIALEDIGQTEDGQRALERFQSGDELAVIGELESASAAQARSVAQLAVVAYERGKLPLTEVISRFEALTMLDAQDIWDWQRLTTLYRRAGQSARALDAAQTMFQLAKTQETLAMALDELGTLHRVQGDLAQAVANNQRALLLREQWLQENPDDPMAQRNVSISLDSLASALEQQGNLAEAMPYYQRSLAIGETLAAAAPEDLRARRDLWVSRVNLASALSASGDNEAALAATERALTTAQELAKIDPDSVAAREDLGFNLHLLGDMLMTQGDSDAATAVFTQSLAIIEALAVADPGNARAQGNWASLLRRIALAKQQLGDSASAKTHFLQALAIDTAVAERDDSSVEAQQALAFSLSGLGFLMETSDPKLAREYLQRAHSVYAALGVRGVTLHSNSDQDRIAVIAALERLAPAALR